MSLKSMFLYKIITPAAVVVVAAPNPTQAKELIPNPNNIEVIKLGCVTADVQGTVDAGIICREWTPVS